jgi:hypothetical protein
MQNFIENHVKYEVKIYQISKSFYELEKIGSNEKIISHLVNEHRKKVEDFDNLGKAIPKNEIEEITYYSYVYNESKKDSHWKRFLPKHITEHHNFEVQRLSFVLFASVKENIYAIVGGGGIRVIGRYLNRNFGLDFYEYLTDPKEDRIVSLTMRGISGKLTEQKDTFRNGQTLLDTLNFTEIPTKINLLLREDLKNSIFDFINFSNDNIYLEIGSYFHIKQKVSFKTLHSLFNVINNTIKNFKPYPLTAFVKEKDSKLIKNEYEKVLINELRDDMINSFGQNRNLNSKKIDIDFIHPSKLQDFYDCNKYQLKAKYHKNPFYETNDMNSLYKAGLKYLYDNLENVSDVFEFTKTIYGMRVFGFHDEKKKTEAMFLQHITCEIDYLNKPVFQIDNTWYKVKNNFIKSINDKCIHMLDKHYLRLDFLNQIWDNTLTDEGDYNLLYKDQPNYYVFDKMLGHNIELCDVMYEDAGNIYLVHVKDGFDAKIRDLSNQINISATRLWTDVNSEKQEFIEKVVSRYNKNSETKIDLTNFIKNLRRKEIVYVMAYRSKKQNLNIVERIRKSKSNIAKYSLIQCVQEMTNAYQLKLFDISDIK